MDDAPGPTEHLTPTGDTELPVVQAPPEPPAEARTELPPPEGGDATPFPPQPVESASSQRLGSYRPPRGFFLTGNDQWGEINFGIYTYVRFLEQKGLDDDYVNGFGQTVRVDKREDLQLAKVKLEFRGWFLDPRFQYTLYTWTNQNAQGQGAQVVVGGNLNWLVDPALKVGAGILSLPSTRSTQGTFPYWLTVDHRTVADEFFRASYSQDIFAYGTKYGFGYYGMLANNLSTLGIDAGQLDGDFTTFSGAVWWMPTTGEYGPRAGFGDYEEHRDLAGRQDALVRVAGDAVLPDPVVLGEGGEEVDRLLLVLAVGEEDRASVYALDVHPRGLGVHPADRDAADLHALLDRRQGMPADRGGRCCSDCCNR